LVDTALAAVRTKEKIMKVAVIAAGVVLAGGLAACGSSPASPAHHGTPPATHQAGVDLTGIPVPTRGSDGTWHFGFPAGTDVTGNLCSAKASQLKARLQQLGVTPGTAGMIALTGGNNAPGTMTICALGY
jgi:hypothetical protein